MPRDEAVDDRVLRAEFIGLAAKLLQDAQWHRFRVECLKRYSSVSEMLDRLIAEQLKRWEEEETK